MDRGPEGAPRPTHAPPAVALAIVLTLWGVTTTWIVSAAGLGLLVWALAIWIGDIREQWRSE